MRASPLNEDHFLRFGAALSSLIFLGSAKLSLDLALDHMARLGTICGAASAPHCGWCFGAAGLAIAGLAAAGVALKPGAFAPAQVVSKSAKLKHRFVSDQG